MTRNVATDVQEGSFHTSMPDFGSRSSQSDSSEVWTSWWRVRRGNRWGAEREREGKILEEKELVTSREQETMMDEKEDRKQVRREQRKRKCGTGAGSTGGLSRRPPETSSSVFQDLQKSGWSSSRTHLLLLWSSPSHPFLCQK